MKGNFLRGSPVGKLWSRNRLVSCDLTKIALFYQEKLPESDYHNGDKVTTKCAFTKQSPMIIKRTNMYVIFVRQTNRVKRNEKGQGRERNSFNYA